MNTLKISTRLFILIGMLSVLLMAVGTLGLYGIDQSNKALRTVYEDRTVPAGQLAEINSLDLNSRLDIANSVLYSDETEKNIVAIEAKQKQIDKVWQAYMATYLTPEETVMVQKLTADRTQFMEQGLNPAIAALRANNPETARRIVSEKLGPLYVPVGAGVAALIQLQLDVAKSANETAVARYETIHVASMCAIVAGILTAIALGLAITRGIARQLGAEPAEVLGIAREISSGNLATTIAVRPGYEGSVMAGMATMQLSLIELVGRVREGSENVSTASAEIAQGNNDLSTRTERQASALEETAASMEQMAATVTQNAESARQANQMALGASIVAAKGGEIVSQAVETMKGINESSKRISDIISVIDGIAFQTNILALNAAVEAARAGDQGRGFAVVASEVRALAGRSAEAAKEIKSLINASVERVEQGTTQVDEAGATMTEVVASIKRVNDIMGEIAAASSEQAAGVAQIGEAVTQMDQVTQQNAALVEEMAAAAASLKGQSQDLVGLVSRFVTGTQSTTTLAMPVNVRKSAHTVAYQGAERRNPEFHTSGGAQARVEANQVIRAVKGRVTSSQNKQPRELASKRNTHSEAWETY